MFNVVVVVLSAQIFSTCFIYPHELYLFLFFVCILIFTKLFPRLLWCCRFYYEIRIIWNIFSLGCCDYLLELFFDGNCKIFLCLLMILLEKFRIFAENLNFFPNFDDSFFCGEPQILMFLKFFRVFTAALFYFLEHSIFLIFFQFFAVVP